MTDLRWIDMRSVCVAHHLWVEIPPRGMFPIEQANDLPQFHGCRRHHPVSICSGEFQKLLPADTDCGLGSALALAMGVDDEIFLRLT